MANSSNSPLSRRERGEQAAVSISARWKGSHYLDACTAALEYGYLVAARLLDYERAHQLFKQNYFVLRDLSAERWQDVRDAFGHGTSIDAKLNDAWTRYAPVANDNIRFDVTWFDDVDELVTKEEIVKGFLGAGEFSLFVAKPGTAKSVLLCDVGCHIAAGRDWHGRPVKPGLVVFFAAERKGLTERRVAAWRKKHDIAGIVGGKLDLTGGLVRWRRRSNDSRPRAAIHASS